MVQSIKPPSSGFDFGDFLGVLVHIEVLGVETNIQTAYGPSDAVRVNWTALDGPQAGREEPDSLIFPKVLQNQLRGSVGMSLVGRLGQGQAKGSNSAPWVLIPATDADVAAGNAFEASRAQGVQAAPPATSGYQPPQGPTPDQAGYAPQPPAGGYVPPAGPMGYQPPAPAQGYQPPRV